MIAASGARGAGRRDVDGDRDVGRSRSGSSRFDRWRRGLGRHRAILVWASVLLHALSFPPWNLWPLAFVALVPLLRALDGVSTGRAAWIGLVWGTLAIWGVAWWVPPAIAHYYGQSLWFGVAFSMAASIVFAGSYYAGFAATAVVLCRRWSGATRVVLLTAAWVAWELARARLLTGDPWLLLGYALVPATTLIQVADLGGVYLLSATVIACNAALAELLAAQPASASSSRPRPALAAVAPALALLIATIAYGAWHLAVPQPAVAEAAAVPVSIVQGNNPVGAQWRREHYGSGLERYLTATAASSQRRTPRLVLWPESAVTFFLDEEHAYRSSIVPLLRASGAELIVGGPHRESSVGADARYFNSAFLLAPSGEIVARYDKGKLLPFAEYFPLRTIDFLRRRFEQVRWFTPGDPERQAPLGTGVGPAAVAICFEAIFPELIRERMGQGAQFLVNLSNDHWLGKGPGPDQHFAMVVLRAVENRTWVARATTTGVSAIVDPAGRVTARAARDVATSIEGTIVPRLAPTLYQSVGDLFAYACAAVTLAALSLVLVRR